uniref:Uncharacterized protein n=1 Tax=Lepeophtheirus salmonis TaxID=72036 RepID=A0A0K2UCU6_LEPSM
MFRRKAIASSPSSCAASLRTLKIIVLSNHIFRGTCWNLQHFCV